MDKSPQARLRASVPLTRTIATGNLYSWSRKRFDPAPISVQGA
jgi:hypothetical protein